MATKIAQFDEYTIDSLKHIIRYGINKEEAIMSACEITQITDDFMREFKDDITPSIFSKSAMLTMDMINSYPDLFDYHLWLEGDKLDISLLFDPSFNIQYGCKMSADELMIINNRLVDNITLDQMNMYYSIVDESTKKVLFERAIENMTDAEIADFLAHNKLCMTSSLVNKRMTSEIAKNIIENATDLNLSFVLSVAMGTNDLSIIHQIIDDPSNLTCEESTNDRLWRKIVEYLPENLLAQVIDLGEKHSPNAIGYSTLAFCLKYKEFEEDDLLLIAGSFKRNNLTKALASYARAREYENLLCLLILGT